jgi:hypothetical protein
MVEGIQRFLLTKTKNIVQERNSLWKWDYKSVEEYNSSVSSHRARLRQIIGLVDVRVAAKAPEVIGTVSACQEVYKGQGYAVYAVRWSVLGEVGAGFGGIDAEGLLLQPTHPPVARVVAVPDADWSPEMVVGLAQGVPSESQFARRLAESGCQVLIPAITNGNSTFSGVPGIGVTNEPHREWIYRMAFEVGRHVIGYEIQKILAAVDWFASESTRAPVPIGVMGYGEGGLLALYSAAMDSRIDAAVVSGYFQHREEL